MRDNGAKVESVMQDQITLSLPIETKIDEVKARWMQLVLEKCGGDAAKAAKVTDTPLPTLYRILQKTVREA
jgi:DNA-binding NtrC family response regulator